MQPVTLRWSQSSLTIMKTPGPLRIMINLLCLCFINETTKPRWHHLFITWFTIKAYCWDLLFRKKWCFSKYYCSLTMHLVIQGHWWRRATRFMLFSLWIPRGEQGIWGGSGIIWDWDWHSIHYYILLYIKQASLVAQMVKHLPVMQETWVRSLGWDDPLEEGTATHSSILAWRIPMDRGA